MKIDITILCFDFFPISLAFPLCGQMHAEPGVSGWVPDHDPASTVQLLLQWAWSSHAGYLLHPARPHTAARHILFGAHFPWRGEKDRLAYQTLCGAWHYFSFTLPVIFRYMDTHLRAGAVLVRTVCRFSIIQSFPFYLCYFLHLVSGKYISQSKGSQTSTQGTFISVVNEKGFKMICGRWVHGWYFPPDNGSMEETRLSRAGGVC